MEQKEYQIDYTAVRLIKTIHTTSQGLEYRFLGKTRKIIPWNEFSCACKYRWAQYQFMTRNYWKLVRFHSTKNNLRAIGTYLAGL